MNTERAERLERDAATRRLAQTEFVAPLVVEAGAGTGKTALLVARAVSWCLGAGWELHESRLADEIRVARRVVDRLVAITFTEAAAAEMAERVAEALSSLAEGIVPKGITEELLEPAESGERALRAAALADEVHRLQAQTIHSWCHRLLRAYPLEAGLHPSFEVDADGSVVESVVLQAVESKLRTLEDPLEIADWELLASVGVMPRHLAEALQTMVAAGIGAEELRREPMAAERIGSAVADLQDGLERLARAHGGRLAGGPGKTVQALAALDELSRRLAPAGLDSHRLVDALDELDRAAWDRLDEWKRGKFTKKDGELLDGETVAAQEAAASLRELASGLARLRPDELCSARRVLAGMLEPVAERLRAVGAVTYDELLRATERLLSSSPEVRLELRLGIDQLMVDEFQDTDATQCRIVRWLALDGAKDRRPGLFIVGDPKQSIYGWRRADLAAYDSFKKRVLDDGGAVEPLVRNFRSVQPILDEVERIIEPVMKEAEGIQPAFQPLEATEDRITDPGFDEHGWAPVEHWLAWPVDHDTAQVPKRFSAEDASRIEAKVIASDIRRLHHDADVAWGEIAILIRTTTAQELVLAELRNAEVPFEVARERDYYRQREVVEAAALVRCVLEPGDRLALLTVLRSDAVGVPDAALVPLWESGLPAVMADLDELDEAGQEALGACIDRARQAAPTDLPGSNELPRWPLAVRVACEIVAALRRSVRHDSPDVFVERLRTLWLTEATASARYLGRYRRARLERFHSELETALASSDGSLAPVARFLRRAVEEGLESRLPAEPDLSADAVHVMTIHGAKGLDFEHVYVAQIHRGVGSPIGATTEALRSDDRVEYTLFGWPTPGFARAEAQRKQRERAELVRLLYVAMTRAKRRLVVSGRWRDDFSEVEPTKAKAFADLVSRRGKAADIARQLEEGRARRRESDRRAQWTIAGLVEFAETRGSGAGEAVAVDEGIVWRDATRLVELRDQAAVHSALPIVARVSDLVHDATEVEDDFDDPDRGPRDAALAVGTAVHRLLEDLDLGEELAGQLVALRHEVEESLVRSVPATVYREAVDRLGVLIDRLIAGNCLLRLGDLGGRVVARELPLLLPPDGESAVGAITGTADLVYQEDGGVVVVDFKTDELESDEQIDERAERYRPQLALYARALQDALDLPQPPAAELWFLHPDRIVRL